MLYCLLVQTTCALTSLDRSYDLSALTYCSLSCIWCIWSVFQTFWRWRLSHRVAGSIITPQAGAPESFRKTHRPRFLSGYVWPSGGLWVLLLSQSGWNMASRLMRCSRERSVPTASLHILRASYPLQKISCSQGLEKLLYKFEKGWKTFSLYFSLLISLLFMNELNQYSSNPFDSWLIVAFSNAS